MHIWYVWHGNQIGYNGTRVREKVQMYGLLVAMEDTSAAYLFKLEMKLSAQ